MLWMLDACLLAVEGHAGGGYMAEDFLSTLDTAHRAHRRLESEQSRRT